RQNLVRAQLRVERGPLQKVQCAQIAFCFSIDRADRRAVGRGNGFFAARGFVQLPKEHFLGSHASAIWFGWSKPKLLGTRKCDASRIFGGEGLRRFFANRDSNRWVCAAAAIVEVTTEPAFIQCP